MKSRTLCLLAVRCLTLARAGAQPVIVPDRSDYPPGSTATLHGSGFHPFEAITLQVLHTDGTPQTGGGHAPFVARADANGAFDAPWYVNPDDSANSAFRVTAECEHGGDPLPHLSASATFTDAALKVGSTSAVGQSPNPVPAGQSATYSLTVTRSDRSSPGNLGLSITAAGLPAGATFSPTSITLRPTEGYKTILWTVTVPSNTAQAAYPFTVTATRTSGDAATGSGTLIVGTGPRLGPTAVNDAADTPAGVGTTINVRGNDLPVLPAALTVTSVTAPTQGTAVINAGTNTVTYTPIAGFTGQDTFTYTIKDANNLTDTALVTMTVGTVNHAPVAAADSYATNASATLSVAAPGVLANDADADGNAITATLVSAASHGTVTLNANGSFTYVPAAGYVGSDAFSYVADDTLATSNETVVSLIVATAPTITVQPSTQETCASNPITLTVSVTGSGPFTYQWRKNGVDIAGATSSVYVVASTTAADAGDYSVVVTNLRGSVTSNAAPLTVTVPSGPGANIPHRLGPGALISSQTRSSKAADNSEMDQLFMHSDGTNLTIAITGNLSINHGFMVFLDTKTGGDGPMQCTAPGRSSRMAGLNGTAWGLRFKPDYAVEFSVSNGVLSADLYDIQSNAKVTLGSAPAGGCTGSLPAGGTLAFDNSNTGGVSADSPDGASTATSGIELTIPLSQVGNPPAEDDLKVVALLADDSGNVSTQALPGLPEGVDGIPAGTADFGAFPGQPFATSNSSTTPNDLAPSSVAWSYAAVNPKAAANQDPHPPVTSLPTLYNGHAYVVEDVAESGGAHTGNLVAINVASAGTGTLDTAFGTDGRVPLDGPVTGRVALKVVNGVARLYAMTTAGTLYMVDAASGGNIRSVRPLGGAAASSSSTPAVAVEDGAAVAFVGVNNTATGRAYLAKVVDTPTPSIANLLDIGTQVTSSPCVVAGGTRVQIGAINGAGGSVFTVSADLSTVYNSVATAGPVKGAPTLSADSSLFFVGDVPASGNGSFYCFSASNGNILWQTGVGGVPGITGGVDQAAFVDYLTTPNVLYFGTTTGELHARNALTGANVGAFPQSPFGAVPITGGVTLMKPTAASPSGNLYIPTAKGLYLVPSDAPSTYTRYPFSVSLSVPSASGRGAGSVLASTGGNGSVYGVAMQ